MAAHVAIVVVLLVVTIREVFLKGTTAMSDVGGGLEWTLVVHC